jgi:ADP-ribose pyrophosphatase
MPDDRLARYLGYSESHPEWFANPSGAAFEIVLDEDGIAAAQNAARAALADAPFAEEASRVGVAYRDQYLEIWRDAVRFPDGRIGTYIRAVGDGSAGAAILARVDDGRLLLIEHFRHATRSWHWEIPRGFTGTGEQGGAGAARELAEETGLTATEMSSLGVVAPDTGFGNDVVELFLAETSGEVRLGRNEGIRATRMVSVTEFRALIASGELSDGYSIAAFARADYMNLI